MASAARQFVCTYGSCAPARLPCAHGGGSREGGGEQTERLEAARLCTRWLSPSPDRDVSRGEVGAALGRIAEPALGLEPTEAIGRDGSNVGPSARRKSYGNAIEVAVPAEMVQNCVITYNSVCLAPE